MPAVLHGDFWWRNNLRLLRSSFPCRCPWTLDTPTCGDPEPVPLSPCSFETQISAATSDSTMRRKASSWETFSMLQIFRNKELLYPNICFTSFIYIFTCCFILNIFNYYLYFILFTLLSLLYTFHIFSYFQLQLNFSARVHRCSGRLHVVVGRRRHRDPRTSRLHPPRPTPRCRLPPVGCWHSIDIAMT